jgi:hypothetical protein
VQVEDGAQLLDAVHDTTTKYVVFPSEDAAVAYTLWIAATHAQDKWEHATRFVAKSPIKRCGKTRMQEIGRELVHRPISTTNISVAALVRSIDEDDPPTLVLDEADTVFGKGKERDGAEDLRGILNSGHSRGWPYLRWDMKAREPEECATFAMALLGGIGDLPDTIEDPAVVISMRRRAPREQLAPFRRRRVLPELHALRDRLHAWVRSLDRLDHDEPDLPVEDRDADKWESLVVIADRAGGEWPTRARTACMTLCGTVTTDDGTAGERLLADLYEVWAEDETHLSTSVILDRLAELDESPWADWFGKPLTPRGLGRLLHPYGVRSRTVRYSGETPKGYARADLMDPWTRYTLPAATNATTPQPAETDGLTSENGCGGSVADSDSESATCSDQQEHTDCGGVADVAAQRANRVTEQLEDLGAYCSDDLDEPEAQLTQMGNSEEDTP